MTSSIMKTVAIGVFAIAAPMAAQAATVSFNLSDSQGSDDMATDVVLTDVAGGVQMDVAVNDPVNTGDIAAFYFDIGASFLGTLGSLTYSGDPMGVITGTANNTSNVQAGNIGQIFDVGLAIGATGSGGDFFDSFQITVFGAGLDVSDFVGQTFAVRGQTVGPIASGGGGGSSKNFGVVPDIPVSTVPLPAAGFLMLAGLGGIGALRRRKKAS